MNSSRAGQDPPLPAVRVEDDTQVRLSSAEFVLVEFVDPVSDTARMHPVDGKKDPIRLPAREHGATDRAAGGGRRPPRRGRDHRPDRRAGRGGRLGLVRATLAAAFISP